MIPIADVAVSTPIAAQDRVPTDYGQPSGIRRTAARDPYPREVDTRPIGIFDSGFGGLTVARALIDLLPAEDMVYFGDTGRYPYGHRPLDEVASFAHEIANVLVDRFDVKFLVVACNTATAAAIESLEEKLPIPVVGVIEPGVRSLVSATRSGRAAVIGTVGTISSGAYQLAMHDTGSGVELVCAACPGFVEFVERGETSGDEVTVLVERMLAPLTTSGIDALLLGCTHYPYLARVIGETMGRQVVLVSSADETAFEVRRIMADSDLARPAELGPATHHFLSSGDISSFRDVGQRLLGPELVDAESWVW